MRKKKHGPCSCSSPHRRGIQIWQYRLLQLVIPSLNYEMIIHWVEEFWIYWSGIVQRAKLSHKCKNYRVWKLCLLPFLLQFISCLVFYVLLGKHVTVILREVALRSQRFWCLVPLKFVSIALKSTSNVRLRFTNRPSHIFFSYRGIPFCTENTLGLDTSVRFHKQGE